MNDFNLHSSRKLGQPGKPKVTIIEGDPADVDSFTKIVLKWSQSKDNGSSEISSYKIEKLKVDFEWMTGNKKPQKWELVTNTENNTLEYELEKTWDDDVDYIFRVSAGNTDGFGDPSLLYYKPEASCNVDQQRSVTLKWCEPPSDGGSAISSYTIEKQRCGGTQWEMVKRVKGLIYEIQDLEKGVEFEFRVSAENEAGTGHHEPRTYKPEASCNVDQQRSVTLKWCKPPSDGGSAISSYKIEKRRFGGTQWEMVERVKGLICKIQDLEKGVEFEFRVSAENEAGTGHPEPRTYKPGRLNKPEVNIEENVMVLTWVEPLDNGGSTIEKYVIEKRKKDSDNDNKIIGDWKTENELIMPNNLTYTVRGDVDGYQFRVIAVNKHGRGGPSPPHDLSIVLIGKTGSGKSSTANTIVGENIFKPHAQFTSEIQDSTKADGTIFNKEVHIIDTPGFADTKRSDEEIVEAVAKCMRNAVEGVHVFGFTIDQNRFTKEDGEVVKVATEMFGEKMLKHLVIIVTRGDDVVRHKINVRKAFDTAPGPLKKLYEDCGKRIIVINNVSSNPEKERATFYQKIDEFGIGEYGAYTDDPHDIMNSIRKGKKWKEVLDEIWNILKEWFMSKKQQ